MKVLLCCCAVWAMALAGYSQAGLVAHYTFDETSGQTAGDSAGGDQDLVTSNGGVAWTTGLIGGAVDMTQDVMWSNSALVDGDDFTISGWINEAVGQSGYRGIFVTGGDPIDIAGGGTQPGGGTDNWGLNLEGDRRADLRINNTADGSSNGLDSGAIVQGEWQLLTLTYTGNGTNATAKAYLNGIHYQTVTVPADANLETDFSAGGQKWQLGTDRNNNGRRYTGLVDDLAIWNEVLSDTQIRAIYDAGLNGIDAPTALIPEPSTVALSTFMTIGLGSVYMRRRLG